MWGESRSAANSPAVEERLALNQLCAGKRSNTAVDLENLSIAFFPLSLFHFFQLLNGLSALADVVYMAKKARGRQRNDWRARQFEKWKQHGTDQDPPVGSHWIYSGHVHMEQDSGAASEHTAEIIRPPSPGPLERGQLQPNTDGMGEPITALLSHSTVTVPTLYFSQRQHLEIQPNTWYKEGIWT